MSTCRCDWHTAAGELFAFAGPRRQRETERVWMFGIGSTGQPFLGKETFSSIPGSVPTPEGQGWGKGEKKKRGLGNAQCTQCPPGNFGIQIVQTDREIALLA